LSFFEQNEIADLITIDTGKTTADAIGSVQRGLRKFFFVSNYGKEVNVGFSITCQLAAQYENFCQCYQLASLTNQYECCTG